MKIDAGTYVGDVAAPVRDEIVGNVSKLVHPGTAVVVLADPSSENGMSFFHFGGETRYVQRDRDGYATSVFTAGEESRGTD